MPKALQLLVNAFAEFLEFIHEHCPRYRGPGRPAAGECRKREKFVSRKMSITEAGRDFAVTWVL
jgi:hypothetical protein